MAKMKRNKGDRRMLTSNEIDEMMQEEFNPVKMENHELPDETPKEEGIKKTLPYDRARLEYMRMQIGPVQNFYTTLGNILLSLSERIGYLEDRVTVLEEASVSMKYIEGETK